MTSRFLDSKIASGLTKIINGDFEEGVFIAEESAPKKKFCQGQTGRMDDLRVSQGQQGDFEGPIEEGQRSVTQHKMKRQHHPDEVTTR